MNPKNREVTTLDGMLIDSRKYKRHGGVVGCEVNRTGGGFRLLRTEEE